MIELTDQMNRTIRLEKIPERIVSLVPSQTELLFDLGLGDKVVGITKFCIHPDGWFRTKQRVGGTKNVYHDTIRNLQPDLIIGNKEENSQSDIVLLEKLYPVYMSDIFSVADACKMMTDIGVLTHSENTVASIVNRVNDDFLQFPKVEGTVLYLIWANPYMAVGENTFIGDIIRKFGLKNILDEEGTRYLELSRQQIADLNPDFIFLSSEPFPFSHQHAVELAGICKSKIHFVDGELFSWYGSRMLQMKNYFNELSLRLRQKDNS